MHKTLFLHEVKPPTSKTFNFFLSKGFTPFSQHPLFPDFLLQIIILFKLRYAFVLPPLFLRFKSVSKPFQVRSLEWAKNGTYMGVTRDLHGTWREAIKIYMNLYL